MFSRKVEIINRTELKISGKKILKRQKFKMVFCVRIQTVGW